MSVIDASLPLFDAAPCSRVGDCLSGRILCDYCMEEGPFHHEINETTTENHSG